jgi:nephrocystin-4
VHWLHMHDVTAVLGQDNVTSIVLRGLPSASKNVALFCSHPDELLANPDHLTLPKDTHVEVMLHFRPLAVGSLNMVLNVVEQATGAFVDALLICTHARPPYVSRMFEVDLPVGTIVHKKVRLA